tara:strand:- start:123 stop:950 length:828 start_codon:yes stop_codon:yes gene_type:complete
MTYSMATVTPTSTLAASTAEVRLNSDSPIQVPDGINNIVSAIPYYVPTAAFSPDESYVTRVRLSSNDISVEPCRFMMSGVNTGDAAFASVQAPILQEYSLNIPNANGANINVYAQPMVANTVVMSAGCELVYSTGATGQQQYWNTPDALSTGGTVINTRTTLNTITITDGREITSMNALVAPTTAAASTHDVGEIEFQSSDFQVPFPYSFPIAPSFSGLGAAAAQQTNPNGLSRQKFPAGHGVPLAPRALINSFYTNRDAKGVGSSVMPFLSFTR